MVWDFTSRDNKCNEGWCETLHHQTIHAMKGGVRLYITKQYMQWRVVWDFTSDDKEKWWRREVVTKGSGVFADRIGVAAWLLSSGVAMCVERLLRWCCETYCNGCMNVAWALFWGGSWWSTKPCFFRVKWLQPAMKGTSCVRRLRLRSFHARIGSSSVFCSGWLALAIFPSKFL